ncbi:MAG: CBS domain-containing protein [Bacillota bacterium]
MGFPVERIKPINGYKKEKAVGDIMIPMESFSSVSADTTVKDAAYILKNSLVGQGTGIDQSFLLVFENKSIIGFVSIQELLASVQPPNLRDDWYRGWNVSSWVDPVFMKGLFTNLCLEVAQKPVRDIIEPLNTALLTDSTLEEAVFKLFREKRNMLPVLENDRLVGIVRSSELFSEILNVIF